MLFGRRDSYLQWQIGNSFWLRFQYDGVNWNGVGDLTMHCRNYWLATGASLAILGAVTSATAADLPARMPVKGPAPVVAAPFSWTGFYIGIHGGGAWLDHKQQTTADGFGLCGVAPGVADCTLDKSGAAVGGLAGYNFQSGRFVYGIEVDGTWLSPKTSRSIDTNAVAVINPITIHSKVNWLATVRGRLGITMSPTLIYVTGGAAFGGVKSGWFDSGTPPNGVAIDKIKAGWVAGGGIEHAFASNWLVRVEGLYHDLGKDTASSFSAGTTYNTTFRHRVTTVRGAVALRW
jgi:outer membrane immunogenic protein